MCHIFCSLVAGKPLGWRRACCPWSVEVKASGAEHPLGSFSMASLLSPLNCPTPPQWNHTSGAGGSTKNTGNKNGLFIHAFCANSRIYSQIWKNNVQESLRMEMTKHQWTWRQKYPIWGIEKKSIYFFKLLEPHEPYNIRRFDICVIGVPEELVQKICLKKWWHQTLQIWLKI